MSRPGRALAGIGLAIGLSAAGFGAGMYVGHVRTASVAGDFASLVGLQRMLESRFDGELDTFKLLEGARAGLVGAAGDPYTAYLTAEEARQLEDDLDGRLSGIGAEIGQRGGQVIVVAPLDGSPAQAAGLRPGDVIMAIDDDDALGLTVTQAVLRIRGEAGTEVKLTLGRGGQEVEATIKRQVINVPSVKSEMKEGIGYIQISRFGPDTGDKLGQAASDLKANGATKFLIDLRNNPGGYLDVAVDVSSHFLPRGTRVVEEKRFGRTEKVLSSTGTGTLSGVEVMILINAGSASASEIVAGALQDHGVAVIAGEASFGKGSVQDLVRLDGNGRLKVTVAHWFTPSGRDISKDGIKPDLRIEQDDDGDSLTDAQLERALSQLRRR